MDQSMELLVVLSLIGIILAAIISFYLFKLYQVNIDISNIIKEQNCKLNNLNSSVDNIEFAITGTSPSKKFAQDFARTSISSKKLRSDNTSLRDYLERSKKEWRDIEKLNVELKHFREIWELYHVKLYAFPEFNDLKIRYYSEHLITMGIYGEQHDRHMRLYRKIYGKKGSEDHNEKKEK